MAHWLAYTLIVYELMIIAWIEIIAAPPHTDD
jgi:hypothetical protein